MTAQRPATPPWARAGTVSAAGSTVQLDRLSVRRWSDTSKRPMESTLSPQNSTRTGSCSKGVKKCRMRTRTAKWHGPSTWSVRL